MRIDFNRICKLAGINERSRSSNYLNESMEYENNYYMEGPGSEEEEENENVTVSLEEKEKEKEKEEEEEVEVDLKELMSEIRRAKNIIKINEQRKMQKQRKRRQLQENKLKRVIAKEVESVLSEMQKYDDYDSSWVYGKRKPIYSKRGHSAQGSFIPGVGFRRY